MFILCHVEVHYCWHHNLSTGGQTLISPAEKVGDEVRKRLLLETYYLSFMVMVNTITMVMVHNAEFFLPLHNHMYICICLVYTHRRLSTRSQI